MLAEGCGQIWGGIELGGELGAEQGLLLVPAGPRVVRFVPPLVIQPRHLRLAVDRLERALMSLA